MVNRKGRGDKRIDAEFGRNVSLARWVQGVTRADLARQSQIPYTSVWAIESGAWRATPEMAKKIAKALGLPVKRLTGSTLASEAVAQFSR